MIEDSTKGSGQTLGIYLKTIRAGLGLTLRQVETTTGGQVSNAYLSQMENGKIEKPSPHILHSLAEAYGVSYEDLMRRAGYIAPTGNRKVGTKHGQAATFSVDNLTQEEEEALLKYLAFVRTTRGK